MVTRPHAIGAETLEVEVPSEELARALLPRMEDINRRTILPAIERALDDAASPSVRVRIDRIEIDLGTVSPVAFEDEIGERVYRELRRVLEELVPEATERPSAEASAEPEERSRLDLAAHYLAHGTLPFWASHERAFSFEALVTELLDADPGALVALIGARDLPRHALSRLALGLGQATLERLLHALDPEHAALIVAYMLDLRAVHRVEPVIARSDELLAHVLWTLALTYVVRDPGSQFNRKSFTRALITGIAESEALSYRDLLRAMHRGLVATEHRLSLGSSLPAVIRELSRELEEEGAARAPDAAPADAEASLVERYLAGEAPEIAASFEAIVRALLDREPGALARQLRAGDLSRDAIRRVVQALSQATLTRLLHALEPESAALILAYMIDLRAVHRVEPVIARSDEAFGRLLWALVLTYVVHDPGSQFNRKSFVRSLLEGVAEAEALSYRDVLEMMTLGLRETAQRLSVVSSLPAVIRELAGDLGLDDPRADGVRAARRRLVARAVRARPLDTAIDALLDLLPEGGSGRGPLATSIRSVAQRAADPGAVVASAIVALMEGRPIDLEAPIDPALQEDEGAPGARERASRAAREGRRRALLAYLLGDRDALPEEALIAELDALLADRGDDPAFSPARLLADARVRALWAERLPEAAQRRLFALLVPRRHAALLDAAEILASAWIETAEGRSTVADRAVFWGALFDVVASSPGVGLTVDRLTAGLVARFLDRARTDAPIRPAAAPLAPTAARHAVDRTPRLELFLLRARRLTEDAGHHVLQAVLAQSASDLLAAWSGGAPARSPDRAAPPPKRAPARPVRGRTAYRLGGTEEELGEPIFIQNAGLVLTGPFLPHLFRSLDLLGQDEDGKPKIRDAAALSRAVHLLQWLVDGRTDAPEPSLVLNKLLAGAPIEAPVARSITATEKEIEVGGRLLSSMIANWPGLSGTSVAGLRETFLAREGKILRGGERTMLHVQRKTLDVLVDRIPWSVAVVYHPWMAGPIYVTW